MRNSILVTGGTGKTGRRIVERLQNNFPVRVGSRSGTPSFDWEKPSTWARALEDMKSVYVSFHPDLAIPGAVEVINHFTDTARKAGVQRLVLLSGRGEDEAQACENVVINSGIDWTVLRGSWFMQNFSEGFFLESILANHFVLPTGCALEPFVDADDIADVAVLALTQNVHAGKIYELTGPELLSFQSAVQIIGAGTNRSIAYQEVSMDEYAANLREAMVPEGFIALVKYLFTEVLDGRNASTTNDIESILGRKPASFQRYVSKAVETGMWESLLSVKG